MRVGEALVKLLKSYGVDTVFGVPGTHSIELYRGLQAGGVRHILARHEQGAGFMADGYARNTGRPGVCFVITGPGVTNALTAIAQAYSDSVPMLVISPLNDPIDGGINAGRLHEISDQSVVSKQMCAFSEIARSVDEIPLLVRRAFHLFASERPRPVHIHIPLSVLSGSVEEPWQAEPVTTLANPDQAKVQQVATALVNAEQPVIVAGGGCRHYGEKVQMLAEQVPCPVITTVAGRGVLPGTHPLHPGAQLASEPIRELLGSSDYALVLGSELAETDHWQAELKLPAVHTWVNIDDTLSQRCNGDFLHADASEFISRLLKSLPAPQVQQARAAYQRCSSIRNSSEQARSSSQQRHWRLLVELRKSLPDTVRVCSDMTQLAYTAIEHMPWQTPNSWFHPNGYGTLGYAVPAAIGVKLSEPELPVLAIVGDAGFQYTMAEVAVAVEYNAPVVILICNSNSLQQIEEDMLAADIEPLGTSMHNPDFITLSQSLGAQAVSATGLYDVGRLIQSAFDAQQTTVIELCIDQV